MKQVSHDRRRGLLRVSDVPVPRPKRRALLVRTAFSVLSAGTERASRELARKTLAGKALARPDQARQVLESVQQVGLGATWEKVRSRLDALSPLGYSLAGVVVETGSDVAGFLPGDPVACAGGGFANHAEYVQVPQTLCAKVPDGVPLDEAAFATIGAVALQGVRQAAPSLGETVGVVGLGLIGLLTVQLLRASGCRTIGIDPEATRRRLAGELGADAVAAPADAGLDALVRRYGAPGLDAVILTAATSSSDPMHLAARLARDRARIVVVGAVGMQLSRSPLYEKELDIRMSRSYGPGRYDREHEEHAQDYPIGYVRWTEGRNLVAFLGALVQGSVKVRPLVTHRFAIDAADRAYAALEAGREGALALGVLLEYPHGERPPAPGWPEAVSVAEADSQRDRLAVAVIGAGSFAGATLVPILARRRDVRLRTVASAGGLAARSLAERHGFEQCAADAEAAVSDPEVAAVMVASRHDSHADLVVRCLEAGKPVFVEKPLALDDAQLDRVVDAHRSASNPFVMVGFNRRFSPLVIEMREFLRAGQEPLLMHYRVNAGWIPRDHWIHDAREGGGRILGEVCHFVDLLMFLTGQPIRHVDCHALPDGDRYNRDNLAVTLRLADGSVGSILYAANGDRSLSKERLEVFTAGRAAVLDDFRRLTLHRAGRQQTRRGRQDKGHRDELDAFVTAVRRGGVSPIPFEQAALATAATNCVLESLSTGQPVGVRQLPL